MTKNPVTMKMARKTTTPCCPECGSYNVRHSYRKYIDFYGIPKIFRCNCGWTKEITLEVIEENTKKFK